MVNVTELLPLLAALAHQRLSAAAERIAGGRFSARAAHSSTASLSQPSSAMLRRRQAARKAEHLVAYEGALRHFSLIQASISTEITRARQLAQNRAAAPSFRAAA